MQIARVELLKVSLRTWDRNYYNMKWKQREFAFYLWWAKKTKKKKEQTALLLVLISAKNYCWRCGERKKPDDLLYYNLKKKITFLRKAPLSRVHRF